MAWPRREASLSSWKPGRHEAKNHDQERKPEYPGQLEHQVGQGEEESGQEHLECHGWCILAHAVDLLARSYRGRSWFAAGLRRA